MWYETPGQELINLKWVRSLTYAKDCDIEAVFTNGETFCISCDTQQAAKEEFFHLKNILIAVGS